MFIRSGEGAPMRLTTWVAVLGGITLAWGLVSAAEEKKGTGVKIDGLTSVTPADWKEEKPSGKFKKMRYKQFRLPRVEGDKQDALMVINYFGKNSGGSVTENLKRWKGLFVIPRGKKPSDVFDVDELKVGKVKVTTVEGHGTYKSPPFEGGKKIPNYRMIKVYFASPNGPYFFTLIGPDKTVAKHRKGFLNWIKGFK
jgi:hypothetical protein